MPQPEIYTINSQLLNKKNFNPRNYHPLFLFVKEELGKYSELHTFLSKDLKGGNTPEQYFFRKKYQDGIPFVKTSAISRDLININDLHYISPKIHKNQLKRAITHPFNIIFSMTGKFMGKATLSPPIIDELNMSQNSVVMKCKDPLIAAFLCIFLNSPINQTQIKGIYSITKQKYLSQTKINALKVLDYEDDYLINLQDYLHHIEEYYDAFLNIQKTIEEFNNLLNIDPKSFDDMIFFQLPYDHLEKRILTPSYYRNDFNELIDTLDEDKNAKRLVEQDIATGDEIGSENYLFQGVPFIKTSNFLNFGVDYQPNYYCSDAIYSELEQNLKRGDILFTKDGKIGQLAILEESTKVVISSGIARFRTESTDERYWIFLLLASDYGKIYFNRWTVIGSTMAHLRTNDFLDDFVVPKIDDDSKSDLIKNLKDSFEKKRLAYYGIENAKNKLIEKFYNIIQI